MGRVVNVQGQPLKGARVELWQANTHGRYTHPSDTNPAPLDPNFEGFAVQDTDAEGRYRFKTIKPGAYPATANWMRPPHLHFDMTGKINRVITQMYFPGEPLNDKDILPQNIRANKDGLIAKVLPRQRTLSLIRSSWFEISCLTRGNVPVLLTPSWSALVASKRSAAGNRP